MRKLILIMLLLLSIVPCLRGQRKEISQARSYIKSGKDFDKAEKLMEDLLSKDSLNRMNPKIYIVLYQALLKQYEAGNEKLYLSQKCDTALLFNITKRMFSVLEALDSIDSAPDKKGKTKLEYRNEHAAELNSYRPNLYYGGTYNVHKGEYRTAFSFFDAYLDCGNQPLFSKYNYWKNDGKMLDAAFWATYCGFKLHSPDSTLMYSDIALKDTSKLKATLVYVAEAHKALGNKAKYHNLLIEGFGKFPTSRYFFTRLMDYHTSEEKLDSALAVVNRVLAIDGSNPLYLFAKSTVLLNMGRYDECIDVSDSMIHVNDTLAEAYYNAGTACLNKALTMEQNMNSRKSKAQAMALYKQALPYMEKYRQLATKEKNKWGPALYKIYLKLNMGKQFEEIDAILGK